ncbi:hypothetical protein C8J56DRAFT_787637, partial [Mycena floridula]
GIDFRRVDIVCLVGLHRFQVDQIQSYGRVVRQLNTKGLAVQFYEAWAAKIDLEEYSNGDTADLDRPRSLPLRAKPSMPEQAGFASVSSLQPLGCKRKSSANYLNDTTANGE